MQHDPVTFGEFLLSCPEGITLFLLFFAFVGTIVFFTVETVVKNKKQNKE